MEGKAKGKEREVEREGSGKEEEEGHRVVRGRGAPPPMEGKDPREGQRMAIGQWAPPVANENNTPWRHAKSPPNAPPPTLPEGTSATPIPHTPPRFSNGQ